MVAGLAVDKGHAKITVQKTGAGKRSFVQWLGSMIEKHRLIVIMTVEIGGERYRENFSELCIR